MAGLLDLFTDPLGFKGINKQRAAGDAFARKMYNPNVFNPLTEEARRQSVEGVDDASMRTGALRRLFAGQPQRQASAFGGNQAAMLSANTAMNASLAGAQAGAELDIQTQEEQAKRAGRASLAELFSKQKQTLAIQEAAVEQNKMFAQAEKNRRTNEFIGGVTGLGMDMLSAYASGGISSLFGGGEKAVSEEILPIPDVQGIDVPETKVDMPSIKLDDYFTDDIKYYKSLLNQANMPSAMVQGEGENVLEGVGENNDDYQQLEKINSLTRDMRTTYDAYNEYKTSGQDFDTWYNSYAEKLPYMAKAGVAGGSFDDEEELGIFGVLGDTMGRTNRATKEATFSGAKRIGETFVETNKRSKEFFTYPFRQFGSGFSRGYNE